MQAAAHGHLAGAVHIPADDEFAFDVLLGVWLPGEDHLAVPFLLLVSHRNGHCRTARHLDHGLDDLIRDYAHAFRDCGIDAAAKAAQDHEAAVVGASTSRRLQPHFTKSGGSARCMSR